MTYDIDFILLGVFFGFFLVVYLHDLIKGAGDD